MHGRGAQRRDFFFARLLFRATAAFVSLCSLTFTDTTHLRREPPGAALPEDYSSFYPLVHDVHVGVGGTAVALTISWIADGPLPAEGFGVVDVLYYSAPGTSEISWRVVFPVGASTTSVSVPALPPAYAAAWPGASSVRISQIRFGSSVQLPYAVARQSPDLLLLPPSQLAAQLPLGSSFELRSLRIQDPYPPFDAGR